MLIQYVLGEFTVVLTLDNAKGGAEEEAHNRNIFEMREFHSN